MKVAVVAVIFNTSEVRALSLAGAQIIVVDNTPDQDLALKGNNIHYIPLKSNQGIAFAQNRGIEQARELGCTHVVFIDDDSEVPADYPTAIATEYEKVRKHHPNLFALGPRVEEKSTGLEYKSAIHHYSSDPMGFSPRPTVISSGSCLSMDAITRVGTLWEELFIDFVDHEWCYRAASRGMVSGLTLRHSISHQVGSKTVNFLGSKVFVSAPFRYYYIYRNYLWLARLGYIPRQWKAATGIKLIAGLVQLPPLTGNWRLTMTNQWRGIKHGLRRGIKARKK